MRSKIVYMATIAMAMVFGLTAQQAEAAQVHGTYSNFKLHNFTGQPVNDLELILRGPGLTCADVDHYFNGWGTPAWPFGGGGGIVSCVDLGGGRIKIIWSQPGDPIPPSYSRHCGVYLKPGNPNVRAEEAIWTFNGVPVGRISFIVQTWVGSAECPVGDIIWPPDSTPVPPDPGPPWTIERAWGYTPTIIPLDSLEQDNPMVASLDWVVLPPETMDGAPLELWTDPLPQEGAVVVQYSVYSGGELVAVFTNEAELEVSAAIPTLTEWGLIIFGVVLLGFITWVFLRRRKTAVSFQ